MSQTEPLSFRSTFMAGWEIANWESGISCPNSNITLAEFSACLNINWPPENGNVAQYIQHAQEHLEKYSHHLSCWFTIGRLTNGIVIEFVSYKRSTAKRSITKKVRPRQRRLLDKQAEIARVLVQAELRSEERDAFVSAVQQMLNHRKEEVGVRALVGAAEFALERLRCRTRNYHLARRRAETKSHDKREWFEKQDRLCDYYCSRR